MIAGLLAACAAVEPQIATHIRQPDEPAERNFTSFSDSLRCMDDLMVSHGIRKTLVTSNGFPDLTSSVRIAADDMLVRAIGLMNARSHAFVFIDQALEKDLGQNVYITERPQHEPEVYIRGAISQYDKKSVEEEFTLPFGIEWMTDTVGGGELNGDRIVGVITVDMHLVTFPDKLIMPGSSVSNSMVLVEDALGGGLTGIFGAVNYKFTWKATRIESPGQAVRNLIELGTIELLGRYAGVPYWQCLAIDRTQPEFSTTEQAAWWAIPDLARIGMVQRKLHKLGYLGDFTLGIHDVATRRAISRFQADNRLIATGAIDFDLHARLKEMVGDYNETSFNPPSTPPPGSVERARFGGESGHPGQVRLSVSPVLPADNAPLQLGDHLVLAIRTDREAFVNCYYQTPEGQIFRVFPASPNDPRPVPAGHEVRTPSTDASFDIILDDAVGEERVMCVAELEDHSVGLPEALRKTGLTPMGLRTLEDVLRAHLKVNAGNVYHAAFRLRANQTAAPLNMKILPPNKPVTLAENSVKTKVGKQTQSVPTRPKGPPPKSSDR